MTTKHHPGYRWERRKGCRCETCPWKGHCRGETWPQWREVPVAEPQHETGAAK